MDPELKKKLLNSNFFKLLYAECDDTQCQRILGLMERIELQPGDILYKEGDVSDSLFILEDGLLGSEINTDGGTKFLGTIRSGQTVGEMGVIAEQQRATTIKALRRTHVLKLSKNAFDAYCVTDPKILLSLLKILVARTTTTIQALEDIYPYVSIAFVPANDKVNYDDFFEQFLQMLGESKKIQCFRTEDFNTKDTHLINQLDEAEHNNDYVIYHINPNHQQLAELFLSRAERVFIIADGTESAHISHFVDEMRENIIQRELILLYPKRMHPIHTRDWLKTLNYSRYHHIAADQTTDTARLVRIITGKALGLVLSGGGTKGWVHAGVLKALEDANIEVDVIGGTSIGAVIGAKYFMENNYDNFAEAMREYAHMNEHPYRINNLTFPVVSIINGKKLTNATKMLFGKESIENLWKPFFCVSCNLSQSSAEISYSGSLYEWTRASTAIPGIMPPVTINGMIYVDGAIINNLPVDVMRDYFSGTSNIIAVDLTYSHDDNVYKLPPVVTFWEAFKLELKNRYRSRQIPKIHDLIMRSRVIGTAEKIRKNAMRADIVIRPDLSQYKLLTETEHTNELFEIGYSLMQEKIEEIKKLLK